MSEPLISEEEKDIPVYDPSDKEVEVVNRAYQRFSDMRNERDKARREFDNITLTEYVNNSMDAYNGILSDAMRASKDDWQSKIWDHKTRGKVKTTIAMIVGMRPALTVTGASMEANKYAADMRDIYEDTVTKENGAYKLYLQALSACNKGTVIVEEIYQEDRVKQKEIISVDHATGKIKSKEKTVIRGGVGHVKSEIVPLLNFYPNENCEEIRHDCCVVSFYSKDVFTEKYGKYTNAEFVHPGVFSSSGVDDLLYESIAQNQDELIEVIRYYNEDRDEFVIMANGFWLNPQQDDDIAPIPFDHKRLPFSKTVFELADEGLFYGKSLPDLMSGEQGADNALLRLMLDQEILALNKPIIVGAGTEIDSHQLHPGQILKSTGSVAEIQEMSMQGATQSGFQLLQLLKNNSDTNTAIDPTAQGVHSGRKTARESVILDENSKRNSGPFQLHIYKLLIDRASQRIENIKQFYTSSSGGEPVRDKNGIIKVKDGKVVVGEKKQREITISEPGKNTRWLKVSPKIKGQSFELRFVEDYEVIDNRSFRIETARAVLDEAKSNPLISADQATIDYLEALRRNPEMYYIKPTKEDAEFMKKQQQGEPQVQEQQA